MKAAIYTRVSLDTEVIEEELEAGEGMSGPEVRRRKAGKAVERQRKDCLALVERKGWDLVGVYTDNSISAFSRKPRPAWTELLDLIKHREVDVVVAWASDRLTRSPLELEGLIDLLEDTGCTVETVTSGRYDLSTPEGRMTARVHGAVARQESERKSVRVAAKKAQLREEGKFVGGQRAFGWTPGRENLVPGEAAEIREWAQRIIAGDTIVGIWKDTIERGVPPVREGSQWKRNTIRGILINPATAGYVTYRGEIVGDATWPAVLDKDTFETVRAILTDPRRKTTYRNSHVLTNIMVDHHGRKMKSQPDRGQRQYMSYKDDEHGPGCAIVADTAEDFVLEAVFDYTDDATLPDADAPVADESTLETLEAEMAELVELRERDEIRLKEFAALSKIIRSKIDAERTRLPETVDLRWRRPGALRREWHALSDSQRKAALREILDSVVVRPHQKGDKPEDRIRINFKL